MSQPTPSVPPSNAGSADPPPGPERSVLARDLVAGHRVHRSSPNGQGAGWYRVKAVRWLARERRYHVTVEIPAHLRNTLAGYFKLTAQARVTVRTPVEESP